MNKQVHVFTQSSIITVPVQLSNIVPSSELNKSAYTCKQISNTANALALTQNDFINYLINWLVILQWEQHIWGQCCLYNVMCSLVLC